ncbi:hypothetical protein ASF22_03830 [Methylobacterium sp. Leaf87]|uniref:hypothetical protein n=1 Tax=Methylobacterium sp. Leaf87 TaxID=1736243 RepID=UPI0006F249B0|nr:hypothetical protein ASF22_03830 [Methylobacterium sp. Leaf87]
MLGALSRALASDAQEARIARLSPVESPGWVNTSLGWRNTSPGATSACHASNEAGFALTGFTALVRELKLSIIDIDHPS